jgi:glycosyltransferase involved in cell wall biosynthesis
MRFHGLMVVRDEEDIIPQTLQHILTWCDALYVYDSGSNDSTWEIVHEFSKKDSRIVPFERHPTIFTDGLRGMVFNKYRDRFEPGDWILRVDADEFYEIPPPQFVREKLRDNESRVDLFWYFFRLTSREVREYQNDAQILADRANAIQLRRRFYKVASYAEPRMFRYRRGMQWSPYSSMPFNAGYVARERIPIRHYPHRDPLQMQRRYGLRARMLAVGGTPFPHWKLEDWRKDVVDVDSSPTGAKEMTADQGLAAAPGHTDGELYEWIPGTRLPEYHFTNHIPPLHTRLMRKALYATVVEVLDSRRPKYPLDFKPNYINEATNSALI